MIRFLAGISRAPFLPLSLLCAILGIACGLDSGLPLSPMAAGLALSAALAAHTSVNAFNEYFDFRSGLDLHTIRTPFSGGSGALPSAPQHARLALGWAFLTLALTLAIGLYFLWLRGWVLASLGMIGIVLVVTYTPWIGRSPWLCLLAPGIGFGPVLVSGTCLALFGTVTATSIWASLLMGVLVSGLLLANQQPDADVDARFGRRHIAIIYGSGFARRVLAMLWLAALPLLLVAIFADALPPLATVVALPLLVAIVNAWQLSRLPASAALPTSILARNVMVCLLTPLLLAACLALARH
ncbi:MAG TPA: prenyltransferase [Pseudomonadales bacterium]|nr:prenyltransferase [Pseudomonadales bacterium]